MRFPFFLLALLSSVQVQAQGSVKFEFTAKGCCPMCEDRIVAALDVPGVRAAEWDQFEEKAMVVYKPKKISEEQIQQLVADVGHDTDLYTATDEAYNGLEACCLYRTGCQGCSDRKKHSDNQDDDRR
jgi:mercuric ion binding protein